MSKVHALKEVKDERAANIAGLRKAIEQPDEGAPMCDQLEYEISSIEVLLKLLESDVSDLAIVAKHPYIGEIDERLASMRAYVALDRMNALPLRGGK